MKIAVPLSGGVLCQHFGHCEAFAILEVSPESREILSESEVAAPEHAPGVFPRWLHEQGVNLVLAGGMGSRAQGLFSECGIQVVTGAPLLPAGRLVRDYLNGTMARGSDACGH